jgi:hypothetical protein
VRIPSRRHDREFFTRLVAALRDAPGVEELRVNPTTASVLIVATPVVITEVVRGAAAQGLFRVGEDEAPIIEAVRETAERTDGVIRLMSGNQLDLRALTFLMLAAGTLMQLARKQWLAPAATLGWYAIDLLAPRMRR